MLGGGIFASPSGLLGGLKMSSDLTDSESHSMAADQEAENKQVTYHYHFQVVRKWTVESLLLYNQTQDPQDTNNDFLCFDFILAALPTGPSTAQFNILHDNKNLTRLSPAASPVRNSLNGGNCLNRSSTGRDSHGGPCHKSLISLSREIKLKKTE